MLENRIIPVLLLSGDSLFKTKNFKNPKYIGDAINTVRIFNEFEVDELIILDIDCSSKNKEINFDLLEQIANECFMPLAYGGGIDTPELAKKIISLGYEKIVVNTANFYQADLIKKIAEDIGSQSVVGVIDVHKNFFGKNYVTYESNNKRKKVSPTIWAKELENRGVGEIIVTSINREGTWNGFDLSLFKEVSYAVNVPIIGNGGAGSIKDIQLAFEANISAVGLGNMVVYQKKDMGVLINFPKLER